MTDESIIPIDEPDPQRTVLLCSVLAVAGFWLAPLAGAWVTTIAVVATLTLAFAVAVLMRAYAGQRRRQLAAGDAIRSLKLRKAHLRLLADNAADVIVEADRDLARRFVSPSSMALLGYSPEELLGRRAVDDVHPDDWPDYQRSLMQLLDGRQQKVVLTQRFRHRDGTYIWSECHVQVTRDPVTGEPNGYVGSLRDITARRAAEAAVRDSEAFLRGVISASPDCIMVLDANGQLSLISRTGLIPSQRDPSTMTSLDFFALWPTDIEPKARSAVAGAAAGATSRFSARCRSADGGPLHLDVVVTPILDPAGSADRLLAICRDVTASAEAEAALLLSQERYRLLAENASEVVMLLAPGPDGTPFYVSPSCHRVLGQTPDSVRCGTFGALVHPDDRDAVRAALDAVGTGGGTILTIHRIVRADGDPMWVEAAFRHAEWAGQPVIVAALRDATERQQRAADLAAAKTFAEDAQRGAEQASLAKSDFLAVMSHEIRTPLNSIIGYTDLLLSSDELSPQAFGYADLIRVSGAALLTVVNDILDFSKIEAGAVELEAMSFSPLALAHHCVEMLRGYAGTKRLHIEVEIASDLPPSLVGDEGRLRQVLLNLLNNAVKFTTAGKVTLRVSRVAEAEHGVAIRFDIIDTGIGVPEAQQYRLFERFSQVDSSVARRFGGSGLGLAICKRLVELMGGTIGMTSRDGSGSTFWFSVTLPEAGELPARQGRPVVGLDSRPMRILLVEDLETNQRVALALIHGSGHVIDVVSDGGLAVAAVAATPYDLVLMDVQMPGMDGVTATRLIRASAGPHRGVPIVAMTANVFPEQIEAFRAAGMDDHVGKPLNRAQLKAVVARWARSDAAIMADRLPASISASVAMRFDREAFDQLRVHLGALRLDEVLEGFAETLPNRFQGLFMAEDSAQRWADDAHIVVSVAGITGFTDLAHCCRALEAEPAGSNVYPARLEAVRKARNSAVEELRDLRLEIAAAVSTSGASINA